MNSLRTTQVLCLFLASCAGSRPDYSDRLTSWDNIRDDRAHAKEPGPEGLEEISEDADLAGLLVYARANNPGLEAAFETWKVALERVPQVTALPNPRLSFGVYLSSVETRVGPTQSRVGLAQPFPWFGELELAGDVAFEASEAAREMLEAARLELDESVRKTWYEYAWVEQAIAITEGNRELLLHWESVARSRMETGIGRHADVIRAQVELGKLEDQVQTLSDLRRPLAAALNAALNRPSNAALPTPSFRSSEPPPVNEEQLMAELATTSPVLRSLDHRVKAAEHGVDLADKAFYPDFFIGADYTFIGSAEDSSAPGSGDDAFALSLGFDLPIWRSAYRAGARGAEAKSRGAKRARQDTLNRLSAGLEMSLYKFRDADRRVGLYRDSLVPKGEESIQALDIAYQSSDGGFLDLIDAERVLLEFQLQVARATADRGIALATTERITGIQLNQER